MTLALSTVDYTADRALGVEPPFAQYMLAGHIMGGSARDSRRSVLPSKLSPASFKGAPTVLDNSLQCSRANGLRLLKPLPDAFSVIVVVRNHILPVNGDVNPLVSDIGMTPSNYVQGRGIALGGAAGVYSLCLWYEGAAEIKQGAYVSLAGVSGFPSMQFLAGTLDGTTTKVYAGIDNELVSNSSTVSDRSIGAWSNKPSFVGTDKRSMGQPAASAAFEPEVAEVFVMPPISDDRMLEAYRWAQEYMLDIAGLTVQ